MGDDVVGTGYTREQRQQYREKVRQCLDVFERMLSESSFEFERPLTGLEIELNLVNDDFAPAMVNAEVLERIADPDYQTELGLRETTDMVHGPYVPASFLLEPGLGIHQAWNGYWFWGRPTNEELRQSFRAVTRAIRPDWEVPVR